MLQFVLRCTRVPVRVGKTVRRAMRHHWNIGHHAAHAIYAAGITTVGTMLVCVAVPAALWVLPPAAGPPSAPPPSEIAAPPEETPSIAPLPSDRPLSPGEVAVTEPSSILVFIVGIVILLLFRRAGAQTYGVSLK